jgi:hypothetical protein
MASSLLCGKELICFEPDGQIDRFRGQATANPPALHPKQIRPNLNPLPRPADREIAHKPSATRTERAKHGGRSEASVNLSQHSNRTKNPLDFRIGFAYSFKYYSGNTHRPPE